MTAPPMPPAETLGSIGPYRLLSVLGEGGMGIVYLAEQREPIRRRVALKVIRRGMDSREVIARFESERQALALMNHPHIARVYDAGTTESGVPFFVMENVTGIPITDYCDKNRLDSRERLLLFHQVCGAIQHAHQKGIIHRDIKPSNILVSVEDGEPRPKVIDFGVAKAINQQLTEKTLFTQRGILVGTPGYMSPEQAEPTALDIDTRTDIYSLGVLLYELMVGTLPFDPQRLRRAGYAEMQRIIREEEPPKPSTRVRTLGEEATTVAERRHTDTQTLQRQLRGDLDWITLKALEKDRTRRYGTAAELASDIERHLHHEPVAASPPDAAYRLKKLVRRHRGLFAAGAAVVAALMVGLVATFLQYRRAEGARKENRRQVVALSVAAGTRLVDSGDYLGALPWYVRALGLEEGGPEREDVHRRRIAAILERSPRLVRSWPLGEAVRVGAMSPNGETVVAAGESGAFRVWTGDSPAVAWEGKHGGEIRDVRFDPTGRSLVTASTDGTLRAWDVQSGRPLTAPLRHDLQVVSAAFSPDGRRILSASFDGTARIWESATGKPLRTFPHSTQVYDAEFSADGQRVATAVGNGTAFVYDAQSGQRIAGPFRDIRFLSSVRFRRDGRAIATGGASSGPRLWDVASGEPLSPPLRHDGGTAWARFSPDGRFLATYGQDGTVRIWDPSDGKPLAAPLKHAGGVWWADFSPDGRHLAAAVEKGHVRVWRTSDWKPVDPLLQHAGSVWQVRFDPTGRLLLTASEDGFLRLWDLAGGESEHPSIRLDCPPYEMALLPQGKRLLTNCGLFRDPDTYVRIWDLEAGEPSTPPLRHAMHAVYDVDREGRRVATGGADLQIRVWDAASGEPTSPPVSQGARFVTAVRFSPDGERLLTVSGDLIPGYEIEKRPGEVWVRNVSSGAALFPPLQRDLAVEEGWFAVGGDRVMFVEGGRRVSVIDAGNGRSVSAPHAISSPTSVDLSGDGRYLAVGHAKGVEVWLVEDWSRAGSPIEFSTVIGSTFSPDARRLATAGVDGSVRVWDVATGRQVAPPAEHPGSVMRIRFSADGRFFVAASADGSCRVWDASDGSPVTPSLPLEGGTRDATFSLDGRRIIGAARGGEVRVWDFLVRSHPLPILERLAGLLSGARIDASGARYPLPREQLEKMRSDLERAHPDLFEVSDRRAAAWYRRAALDAARQQNWNEVIRMATVVLERGPRRAADLELRGGAFAEMGLWADASRDYREASACRPDDVGLRRDLALVSLASGDEKGFQDACASLLNDFAGTSNPDNAHAIARTAALWRDPPSEISAGVLDFAEIATRGIPGYFPWRATLAAAAYRAGDRGRARVLIDQAQQLESSGGAQDDRFLAALETLVSSRPTPASSAARGAPDWRTRLEALALDREAGVAEPSIPRP